MQVEHAQNFQERLNQWVAKQGFWFQMRYSMTGVGAKGEAMFHLLRLAGRLGIFLMIAAVAGWFFLEKRTESRSYHEKFKKSLKVAFSANEVEMQGFRRKQSKLEIHRLAGDGGTGTFFQTFEARNIRHKMSLFDGLAGKWDPGTISIFRLNVDLQAGANDAESAKQISEALFRVPKTVDVESIEVTEANLSWGYSAQNRGRIEGASMKIRRLGDSWRVTLKGGTFSQNWLRRLQIVEIVAVCDREGIVFEKASFRRGSGTVDFHGVKVVGGARPEVSGSVELRGVSLDHVLPVAVRNFVEGVISGDFSVSGSTNSSEGIGLEGQVVLDGLNRVTLRDRVHLLRALSVVDAFNNYRRIDFREGSFQMKTSGGGLELQEVDLKAGDLFEMKGTLSVRQPTDQERKTMLSQRTSGSASPLFTGEEEDGMHSDSAANAAREFTLRRAAREAKRLKEGGTADESLSLFDRVGLTVENRILEEQEAERLSRMLLYHGNFQISLPPDAFDRAENLQSISPKDSATGRIPMTVPIEGGLYELTLKQAEYIYEQGRR